MHTIISNIPLPTVGYFNIKCVLMKCNAYIHTRVHTYVHQWRRMQVGLDALRSNSSAASETLDSHSLTYIHIYTVIPMCQFMRCAIAIAFYLLLFLRGVASPSFKYLIVQLSIWEFRCGREYIMWLFNFMVFNKRQIGVIIKIINIFD